MTHSSPAIATSSFAPEALGSPSISQPQRTEAIGLGIYADMQKSYIEKTYQIVRPVCKI